MFDKEFVKHMKDLEYELWERYSKYSRAGLYLGTHGLTYESLYMDEIANEYANAWSRVNRFNASLLNSQNS